VCYELSGWKYWDDVKTKFKLHDHGTRIQLPSRELLAMHAAIAKIFHMTGAGERYEKILRDKDEIPCLAEDGSTNIAEMLNFLVAAQ
jgi:hypothetical protein